MEKLIIIGLFNFVFLMGASLGSTFIGSFLIGSLIGYAIYELFSYRN